MSVEVKAARERSGYPPSLAVAENRRCQHFGALDGHFVAMGSLLTYFYCMRPSIKISNEFIRFTIYFIIERQETNNYCEE